MISGTRRSTLCLAHAQLDLWLPAFTEHEPGEEPRTACLRADAR